MTKLYYKRPPFYGGLLIPSMAFFRHPILECFLCNYILFFRLMFLMVTTRFGMMGKFSWMALLLMIEAIASTHVFTSLTDLASHKGGEI